MEFKDLVTIEELEIHRAVIVLTKKTKLWCKLPYKDHKNGCFNYNKNLLCPPHSPYFGDIINCYKHFYLIYAIFNFKKYKELRKEENPDFFNSEARLKCVIYWQGSVKSLLRGYIKNIYDNNYADIHNFYLLGCGSGFNNKLFNKFQKSIYSMESVGIDVYNTLKLKQIDYEFKPVNKVVLVCLLSSKIDLNVTDDGGLF